MKSNSPASKKKTKKKTKKKNEQRTIMLTPFGGRMSMLHSVEAARKRAHALVGAHPKKDPDGYAVSRRTGDCLFFSGTSFEELFPSEASEEVPAAPVPKAPANVPKPAITMLQVLAYEADQLRGRLERQANQLSIDIQDYVAALTRSSSLPTDPPSTYPLMYVHQTHAELRRVLDLLETCNGKVAR